MFARTARRGDVIPSGPGPRRRPDAVIAGLATICAVILLTAPAFAQSGRAERGRVFLQEHCAGCHAIGRVGESPLSIAPPFRILHQRYPVETLAEAFAEGITTGHPTMPEFQLDPAQINDVLAYLKGLER